MAKEKSAKELGEIMAEQLDVLRDANVSEDAVRIADSVANMIGKVLKLSALELAYAEAQKRNPGVIPSLEREKGLK